METTKLKPRIDGQPCDTTHPIAIFIKSAAQASGKYYDKRQVIRKTWINDAKKYNISGYFVLGLNTNERVNELIKTESNQFRDIIQMSFIESYFNLTLKTVSIYRWIQNNCQNTEIVLKADDDTIVNCERLLNKSNSFEPGIHGHRVKGNVTANYAEKYHTLYGERWEPQYVYGGAYITTTNVIGQLLNTLDNYKSFVHDQEDVALTGFIAETAGVKRYKSYEFEYRSDNCGENTYSKMSSLIAFFDCKTAKESFETYSKWKGLNQTFKESSPCPIPTSIPGSSIEKKLDKLLFFSTVLLYLIYFH
jgi:hypothetical protein